jgi:hypothetical protein
VNTKYLKTIPWLAILVVLLITLGCAPTTSSARVGSLQTESQSVELGDIESVRVEIDMGAGELNVTSGADELMEADFTYNVAALKPEVEFRGRKLTIRQPEVDIASFADLPDYRYEWDLRFNDNVPMDMNIKLGTGKMDLEMAGLSLTALEVNMGASRSTLDLTGDWASDLDINITGGVSSLTVRLPSSIGVRVEISGISRINASGLVKEGKAYVNDAYGKSDVTLDIFIEAGLGEVNLEVGD